MIGKPRCIVTGISRGIGKAIADELLNNEFGVVGLGRMRPDGWQNEFIECDLADRDALDRLDRQVSGLGPLWGLVNNAGRFTSGSIHEIDVEDFEAVLRVNTVAPAVLVRVCARQMTEGGRVVNICSSVTRGKAERTVYGASKAALVSMTFTWALELASQGILVNAISPGPIDTQLFRRSHAVGSEAEQGVLSRIPVGRLGDVRQIAALVRFMLAPENDYLTGQVVTVDGGRTIASEFA